MEGDLILICIDCDQEFTISLGELKFFKEKGLFMPKRCRSCRIKKKRERFEQEAMHNI